MSEVVDFVNLLELENEKLTRCYNDVRCLKKSVFHILGLNLRVYLQFLCFHDDDLMLFSG